MFIGGSGSGGKAEWDRKRGRQNSSKDYLLKQAETHAKTQGKLKQN